MTLPVDIVTSNTQGLRRDAEIVSGALSVAFRTRTHVLRQRNADMVHRRWLRRAADRFGGGRRLLVFLEKLPASWMRLEGLRVLIPNQEWMWPEVRQHLADCHEVWCKTRYADGLFRQAGYRTRCIGFTSRDIHLGDRARDYGKFIHVGGRSHLKGTGAILALWKRHPEWPPLLVITAHESWLKVRAPNITVRRNNVPDGELQVLMNEHGVHLCPSEAEGFGHYIAEALSAKAIVITVAAPPMNEMVAPDFGLFAQPSRTEAMGLGMRFFVDPDDLERSIETAIALPTAQKVTMGESARRAFLQRQADFPARIRDAAETLCATCLPVRGQLSHE